MASEKRLIDANAFWNRLRQVVYDIAENDDFGRLQLGYSPDIIGEVLKQTPTVDAVEVVHGRWVARKNCGGSTIFKCSECSREVKATNDYFGKPSDHVAEYYPYCHCGAKMDGDKNGS